MTIKLIDLLSQGKHDASLDKTLQDRFVKIFPTWPLMLATLISLTIVITLLYFWVYRPIKKAMKNRQDYIQNNIDQAKETNNLSQQKLAEANKKLLQAHEEAKNIVKEAKVKGESVIQKYTDDAKKESIRIHEEAKLDIAQQKQTLLEESKNQIVEAATELSRKILQKEISKQTEKDIIDSYLKENN